MFNDLKKINEKFKSFSNSFCSLFINVNYRMIYGLSLHHKPMLMAHCHVIWVLRLWWTRGPFKWASLLLRWPETMNLILLQWSKRGFLSVERWFINVKYLFINRHLRFIQLKAIKLGWWILCFPSYYMILVRWFNGRYNETLGKYFELFIATSVFWIQWVIY